MDAKKIIESLGLKSHPEGGWYRETWRHENGERRGAGTAIYYLLRAGEESHWHRIDSTEIWHHYAGAPLLLRSFHPGNPVLERVLGNDLLAGQRPQLRIEPGEWQAARTLGQWSLMGCTVSPAFEFERFEMAPPDFCP